jgi:hypothetical protein
LPIILFIHPFRRYSTDAFICAMPVCEGLPSGPCPQKRNDKSVTIGNGDLMLCQSCDAERRRLFDETKQSNDAKTTSAVYGKTRSTGKPTGSSNAPLATTSGMPRLAVYIGTSNTATSATRTTTLSGSEGSIGLQPQITNAPLSTTSHHPEVKTIINELLTYVVCYRDRCSPAEMH